MKYVKKDNVVKEVTDTLAGNYVSAGWSVATKADFDKSANTAKISVPSITSEKDGNY